MLYTQPFVEYSSQPTAGIIDMKQYNGRINVMADPADPDAQFRLFEKVSVKNKATEYREALTGFRENCTLSRVFFSRENVDLLQHELQAGVFQMSEGRFTVAPQNTDQLKIIMRAMYFEHGIYSEENIKQQVADLNRHVLTYCVPFVYREAVAYTNYLRDQSTLVLPMERAQPTDRDYKQLRGRV